MLSDSLRDGLSELEVFTSLTNVPLSRRFLTGLLEGLTGLALALFVLSALLSCIRFEVLGLKVGHWTTRHQIAMLQARRWRSSREHSSQASCLSPPRVATSVLSNSAWPTVMRGPRHYARVPTHVPRRLHHALAALQQRLAHVRAPSPLRLCAPVRERMPAEEAGPGPGDGLRWSEMASR